MLAVGICIDMYRRVGSLFDIDIDLQTDYDPWPTHTHMHAQGMRVCRHHTRINTHTRQQQESKAEHMSMHIPSRRVEC